MKCKMFRLMSMMFAISQLASCGRSDGPQKTVQREVLTNQGSISFDDVRPILQSRCTPCHNFGTQYGAIYPLAKDGKNSLVYRYVVDRRPREMPPPNTAQAQAITREERSRLANWSSAGAPQAGSSEPGQQPQIETVVSPQATLLRQCWSCHGEDGRATLAVRPNLAGQPAKYLEAQLHSYKNMTRIDSTENRMNEISKDLTDSQIAFLSDYFSFFGRLPRGEGQTLSVEQSRHAEAVVRQQKCTACHSPNSGVFAGELFGQNQSYLAHQLMAFRTGKRKSIAMEMVARDLAESDIQLISAWLAAGGSASQSKPAP